MPRPVDKITTPLTDPAGYLVSLEKRVDTLTERMRLLRTEIRGQAPGPSPRPELPLVESKEGDDA